MPTLQHALWASQFGWILRAVDSFLEPTVEISVEMHHVDLEAFVPLVLECVDSSTGDDGRESLIADEDWHGLRSACETFRTTPFTLPEAFELLSILRWCAENSMGDIPSLKALPLDQVLNVLETDYHALLTSALEEMEAAYRRVDTSKIVELVLRARANLVVDAHALSPAFVNGITETVDKITAYQAASEQLVNGVCHQCIHELTESSLAFDWKSMDNALGQANRLLSYPNLAPAFDVSRNLSRLRERQMAALATYLFAADVERDAEVQSDPHLRELVNALQAGHRPIREIHSLLSLFRADELQQCLQLRNHTTVKEILLDAIKTLEFMFPMGQSGEPITHEANALLGSRALLDSDNVLMAKFSASWFIPPLLLSALRFPDRRFYEPFLEAWSVNKWMGLWSGLDGAFGGLLIRSFDSMYPEHPPLLLGHALGIYADVIELYNSKPTNIDEMTRVLRELYGVSRGKLKSRMQEFPLHKLSEAAVDRIGDDAGKKFLLRCYARAGFIVTEESLPVPRMSDVEPEMTEYVFEVEDPETEDPVWRALMQEEWKDRFDVDYPRYRQITKDREYFEALISNHCAALLREIGQTGVEPPSLSRRIRSTWPAVMRDIVLSRIVLTYAKIWLTAPALAQKLGYATGKKDEGGFTGKDDVGGLRKHLSRCRIDQAVRIDPRKSTVLYDEDKKWIMRHRRELK